MIRRDEFQQFAAESGLREEVIEKDYAIGWVLWGIAMNRGSPQRGRSRAAPA